MIGTGGKLAMLAALLPAAANPSLVAQASGLQLALCGEGPAAVSIPLDRPVLPGSDTTLCCAKGCHTSQERKRAKGDCPN